METINRLVAVEPFETNQTKIEVHGGLAHIKQKAELTKLRVVYNAWKDSGELAFCAGSFVYVRGDVCKHANAKQVYEVEEGRPFVLLELGQIVGCGMEEERS